MKMFFALVSLMILSQAASANEMVTCRGTTLQKVAVTFEMTEVSATTWDATICASNGEHASKTLTKSDVYTDGSFEISEAGGSLAFLSASANLGGEHQIQWTSKTLSQSYMGLIMDCETNAN